jgi:hypothetical protein
MSRRTICPASPSCTKTLFDCICVSGHRLRVCAGCLDMGLSCPHCHGLIGVVSLAEGGYAYRWISP